MTAPARPVTVLSAGGTIAMAGPRARPALGAEDLVAAVPQLAGLAGLRARSVLDLPGAHLSAADALAIARAALEQAAAGRGGGVDHRPPPGGGAPAAAGRGVVVTHGTDTLEESAVLCDALHGVPAPVVFTGAIRPSSAVGADGPANLADAVAAAGAQATSGLGTLVAFAGELHAARAVRKVASTSPVAFGSPLTGPVGAVAENHVRIFATPARAQPFAVAERLDANVPIVVTWLGDDGTGLRAAARDGADAIVFVTLGAGHIAPPVLAALREVAATVPVALCVRPPRGALLRDTYGFEGAERDLRESGGLPAATLSPQAARMILLAGLGAGAGRTALAAALEV